jgi:hypothetical protein|tara:strand:- start:42 stop:266 length:225 start_codon:yes stop_codon:yes gene_type:complete
MENKMMKILHNQIFWAVVWGYTIIINVVPIFTDVIISKTFDMYLYIVSAIFICPLMLWGAYNSFRKAKQQKKNQ